jgi:hypothetical protein
MSHRASPHGLASSRRSALTARVAVAVAALLVALSACTDRDHRVQTAPDASTPSLAAPSSAGSARLPSPVPSSRSERGAPGPLEGAGAPAARGAPRAPSSTPVAVAALPWTTYRGDGFTILFPGEPKVTVLPAEDDKAGYTEALLDVPGGQVSFAAGFTEHTAEEVASPEAFLEARANAPRRGTTDVLHKRSITLGAGQPGRVLILRRNISGTPLRIYSRLYLVGRRLYSLIVSTLDVGGVGEDVVKRFMESFKLP